jgi:POT family proton-dependent oligopeptide transporter
MKSIFQALFNLFSALGSVFGIDMSFAAYDPSMVIVYGSITGLLLFVIFGFEFAYFALTERENPWSQKHIADNSGAIL